MEVSFRFYAELNNFLHPTQRGCAVPHVCPADATVKHMMESLGVPHTEAGLILVDGVPADFSFRLRGGERVSVYPVFTRIDTGITLLRPPLEGAVRFIADAHLGQLAKNLRMLGFDVLYRNDYSDAEVARIAAVEHRVVLTRDRDLLIRKEIVFGCYLHSLDADSQAVEVLTRFRLAGAAHAFSRCLACNGMLLRIDRDAVVHRVPGHSWRHYEVFYECTGCEQVYWEGSHVERMRVRVAKLLGK